MINYRRLFVVLFFLFPQLFFFLFDLPRPTPNLCGILWVLRLWAPIPRCEKCHWKAIWYCRNGQRRPRQIHVIRSHGQQARRLPRGQAHSHLLQAQEWWIPRPTNVVGWNRQLPQDGHSARHCNGRFVFPHVSEPSIHSRICVMVGVIRIPYSLSVCNEVILSKSVSHVGILYTQLYNQHADSYNG